MQTSLDGSNLYYRKMGGINSFVDLITKRKKWPFYRKHKGKTLKGQNPNPKRWRAQIICVP